MRNGSESRDLNRARLSTGASDGKRREASSDTARITINEPWRLDLPQKVVDHFEKTSALTGIEPSKLIAAAIVQQFAAAEVEKKKPETKGAVVSFSGANVPRDRTQNPGAVQLLLQLGQGLDSETA